MVTEFVATLSPPPSAVDLPLQGKCDLRWGVVGRDKAREDIKMT
jgi:hypothetical protein